MDKEKNNTNKPESSNLEQLYKQIEHPIVDAQDKDKDRDKDKLALILDAAFHLFGTKGFYETKMAEIAGQAHIAKGTVYLYFSSKEALFKAMTIREFEICLANMRLSVQSHIRLDHNLNALAYQYLNYFYDRRAYTLVFFQAPTGDPELMQIMCKYIHECILIFTRVLTAGGIKEPELKAKAFIGILDMYKMDILFTKDFKREEMKRRAAFAANLFINGGLS
jgi:TetR/AcrR family fatty acid metabolism transcriptional regulator